MIQVTQVSKRYWLRSGTPVTFQEAAGKLFGAVQQRTPFWALKNVTFAVQAGETVGVIGRNGAGKSTLLRLICGLGKPTSGRVQVQGRVAALLDLGVGFHPHLTGRENLYTTAIISGLRRKEVDRCYDQIVAFSEIGPFMDQPLRTYSSGMMMRLAFSVAIHVDPDLLIIDEALSVGDAAFQQKCLERIEQFQKDGKTLLIVSHDLNTIRRFCDRALWIAGGQLVASGDANEISNRYEANGVSFE